MSLLNVFQRVSQSPTNPHPGPAPRTFDVAELYRGPVTAQGDTPDNGAPPLDEKLRQAYFWIVNTAIISPPYDVEFNDGPPQSFVLGDSKSRLTLPSGQSYSSFVLLPLLTFATRRKCLLRHRGEIVAPDGRRLRIRTVWQLDRGQIAPRLITAYPLEVTI